MSVLTISPTTPALVLFGRDQAGKPHASWFDAASVELAIKAAGLMSMRAVPVESDALREVAASLPRGRLFSSGRAFTPFVKGKLYERLVEATGGVLAPEPAQAMAEDELGAKAAEALREQSGVAEADPAPEASEAAAAEALATVAPAAASASVPAAATEPAPPAAQPVAPAAGKPTPRPSRVEDVGPGSIVLATTGPAEGWFEARVLGVNGAAYTLKWVDYHELSFVRRGAELGFLPRLTA